MAWHCAFFIRSALLFYLASLCSCAPKPQELEEGYAFAANPFKYWPGGMVKFTIDKAFSYDEKRKIRRAMDEVIASLAPGCVRFEEKKSSENVNEKYVKVIKEEGGGCKGEIGRAGSSDTDEKKKIETQLTLGEQCFKKPGTVLHEILHTLGSVHEHVRPDRNLFVNVTEESIKKDNNKWPAQYKRKPFFSEVSNTPYDINSIMHYGEAQNQAAKKENSKIPIMSVREPFTKYKIDHDRDRMTSTDIVQLSRIYSCAVKPDVMKDYMDYVDEITTLLVEYMDDCVREETKKKLECLEGYIVGRKYLREWRVNLRDTNRSTRKYDSIKDKFDNLKDDFEALGQKGQDIVTCDFTLCKRDKSKSNACLASDKCSDDLKSG